MQVGKWEVVGETYKVSFNHQDLFASMLFRLEDLYGGEDFMRSFWRAVALRPAARSIQDAVDNLVLSASSAANRNLAPVFLDWRFPVSAAAQAEAANWSQ
jgi:hypothetical protein